MTTDHAGRQPGFRLSALLRWYDFHPVPMPFGTYVLPTQSISFSDPDGPPYVHRLGVTRGPAFTVRETLPPFVTAAWTRRAVLVAADAGVLERNAAYLSDAIARRRVA